MKTCFLTFFILLFAASAMGQTYLETIAEQTCNCISSVEENLDSKAMSLALGQCMVQQSQAYALELKRDLDIDVKNLDDKKGKILGENIGGLMAAKCPGVFKNFISKMQDKKETKPNISFVKGKIIKVVEDTFVQFALVDQKGVQHSFVWLRTIASNINIETNYMDLMGQQVFIQYEIENFFDSKSKTYKPFKVIKHLEKF